ncbi:glycosyltransferase [Aliiroseovarius zhejiangensis]|nr:glycosyltransferase [Aliiroseovarius zhejiangensis]
MKAKRALSGRTHHAHRLPSGLETVAAGQDYDLFFYSVAHLEDLNFLSSLKGWRERSTQAICWIQELWLKRVDQIPALVDQLNAFDHVICSFVETAKMLRDRLDVPVTYIPWGVDMLRFCPCPNPPRRAIDMLSIGVAHPNTHEALIKFADETGQFYSYETISGRAIMKDFRAHRDNYIAQLKRARYFFSYIAKVERTVERGPQIEFGLRYLEGLAAGAIVLGNKIDSDAFREHIGWEDAVIDAPYDCPQIGDIISTLDEDPDRCAAIRARNVTECLTRHDHLHRWEKVLDLAGLSLHPKLAARRDALAERVKMVEAGLDA